jgi:hypothetical protein
MGGKAAVVGRARQPSHRGCSGQECSSNACWQGLPHAHTRQQANLVQESIAPAHCRRLNNMLAHLQSVSLLSYSPLVEAGRQ